MRFGRQRTGGVTLARELSDYENVVSAELLKLGFKYCALDTGGGYYWKTEGQDWLQLTDDLQFLMRGCRRVWTLKRVNGLKIWDRTFGQRKRTAENIAKEITKKLKDLFAREDWREDKEWNLTDLSG